MEIKILGPGCSRCDQTEQIVRAAASELGLNTDIQKVSGAMEIARYGVFGTPAVVVDGEVKCVGKIPEKDEVKGWLKG